MFEEGHCMTDLKMVQVWEQLQQVEQQQQQQQQQLQHFAAAAAPCNGRFERLMKLEMD